MRGPRESGSERMPSASNCGAAGGSSIEGDLPLPGLCLAVLEGEVRVEAAHDEIAVEVGLFGPGAVFGELSAIDGRPRSASAIATQPTTVAAVSPAVLDQLLTEHPSLAAAPLRVTAARLRATTVFAANTRRTTSIVASRRRWSSCRRLVDPGGQHRDARRHPRRARDDAAVRHRDHHSASSVSAPGASCCRERVIHVANGCGRGSRQSVTATVARRPSSVSMPASRTRRWHHSGRCGGE